eukprot:scaffold100489_cov45-Phaeocystis_antarctica.AAC.1
MASRGGPWPEAPPPGAPPPPECAPSLPGLPSRLPSRPPSRLPSRLVPPSLASSSSVAPWATARVHGPH